MKMEIISSDLVNIYKKIDLKKIKYTSNFKKLKGD